MKALQAFRDEEKRFIMEWQAKQKMASERASQLRGPRWEGLQQDVRRGLKRGWLGERKRAARRG